MSNWPVKPLRGANLLIGNFRINQRQVTGSVVLSSGEYGHDRFKGGSTGCSYTFATSSNITTITISAGTLEQVVEGDNIASGTHVLSWTGTAQGRIDGGSYGDSGKVSATLTGGTDATVEFDTGTLALTKLESGKFATVFENIDIGQELLLCQRYFERLGTDVEFSTFAQGVNGSSIQGVMQIPYITKRIDPTVTSSSAANFLVVSSQGASIELTDLTFEVADQNSINATYTVAGGLFFNSPNTLFAFNTSATIDIDAEI